MKLQPKNDDELLKQAVSFLDQAEKSGNISQEKKSQIINTFSSGDGFFSRIKQKLGIQVDIGNKEQLNKKISDIVDGESSFDELRDSYLAHLQNEKKEEKAIDQAKTMFKPYNINSETANSIIIQAIADSVLHDDNPDKCFLIFESDFWKNLQTVENANADIGKYITYLLNHINKENIQVLFSFKDIHWEWIKTFYEHNNPDITDKILGMLTILQDNVQIEELIKIENAYDKIYAKDLGYEGFYTTILESQEGIENMYTTLTSNIAKCEESGLAIDTLGTETILHENTIEIITMLEEANIDKENQYELIQELIYIDNDIIRKFIAKKPSIQYEVNADYTNDTVSMFGSERNSEKELVQKIKDELDIPIRFSKNNILLLYKVWTAYWTTNWKKNIQLAQKVNGISSQSISHEKTGDALVNNRKMAALKEMPHDKVEEVLSTLKQIGFHDEDMDKLFDYLSLTSSSGENTDKLIFLINKLGIEKQDKEMIRSGLEEGKFGDAVGRFLYDKPINYNLKQVEENVTFMQDLETVDNAEIITILDLLNNMQPEILKLLLNEIQTMRIQDPEYNSENTHNIPVMIKKLDGVRTVKDKEQLQQKLAIFYDMGINTVDKIVEIHDIVGNIDANNIQLIYENISQGKDFDTQKEIFTELTDILDFLNTNTIQLIIDKLQSTSTLSVKNIKKYGSEIRNERITRIGNNKALFNFRFDTISISKISKSINDRRELREYLVLSMKDASFFEATQSLIQEASVGKKYIIKMLKHFGLCYTLGVDLNTIQIDTADPTKKSPNLLKQLKSAIQSQFNERFDTDIDQKEMKEKENLLLPIVTYSNFIEEYPQLEDVFNQSVQRFVQGDFQHYKFSEAFKQEVGEKVYTSWSQEREQEISYTDKENPEEKEKNMLDKFGHNLNQVKTHFTDSQYKNFLITILQQSTIDESQIKEFCKQINEKDIAKITKAVEKYSASSQLLESMQQAYKQRDKTIEELDSMISEFNSLITSISGVLKLDGLEPQVQVLNQTFRKQESNDGTYKYIESGQFDELLCVGKIKNENPCQAYDYPGDMKKGLTGYIELPWIKTVTIRKKHSKPPMESEGRALIKLLKKPKNNTYTIMVERIYGSANFLPVIMEKLQETYPGMQIQYGLEEGGDSMQFLSSGRAPLSYSDKLYGNHDYRGKIYSNGAIIDNGQDITNNGEEFSRLRRSA